MRRKTVSDETLIATLLTSPTIKAASETCGLSERQIFDRRQNPQFTQRLREAQNEALASTTRFLQHATGSAAAALLEIAENKGENSQVRVTAARAVLEQASRFTEIIDFSERLETVEKIAREDDE